MYELFVLLLEVVLFGECFFVWCLCFVGKVSRGLSCVVCWKVTNFAGGCENSYF